jgi:hypothetical protein
MHALVRGGAIIRTENFNGSPVPTLASNKGAWVEVAEPSPPSFDAATHRLEQSLAVVDGVPTRTYSVEVLPVPQSTTPAKARIVLDEMGLLGTVEAAVAAHPTNAVRIYWEYAQTFERNHPYIVALGTALELDLDALFRASAQVP